MSYARKILEEIAQEQKRPVSMVEEQIKVLEDNWYDSQEALQDIDEQILQSFNFPKRLQILFLQKLGKSQTQQQQQEQVQQNQQQQQQLQQQQQQSQQQQSQQQSQFDNQKMEEEIQQKLKTIYPQQQQSFEEQKQQVQKNQNKVQIQQKDQDTSEDQIIDQIHIEIEDNEKFINAMQMLYKILFNIDQNPSEEKFRTLKKSNQKLQDLLFQYPSTSELLKHCQFFEQNDLLILDVKRIDQGLLKRVMSTIQKRAEEIAKLRTFNPYKTHSNIVQGTTNNSQLYQQTGAVSFYDKLSELKQKRDQIMSQPIKNRRIRCYLKGTQSLVEPEEVDDKEYKQMLKDAIIKMAGEEIGFTSKRKQEYNQLLKQQVYQETVIRVKFPHEVVFEAVFSPKETIQDLMNFLKEHLEDPTIDFYIFEAPPKRIFKGNDLKLSFYELEALPGGNYFFGIKDQKLENQQKHFLKQIWIDQL
ncbi:hypothetical protein PPERSA_07445 [Pseudocohnilembus persalinus]|uniref:UBX domain-containing protein n=1 Tax=Pseudocohnilembus persalinus TaxID=266149 RepID=A0A0V0QAI0_PSEPJ|nr:hypothetical protein PPERSA_07445 [Pseudocohnilembus persalinus]|eukprot:KRW99202.1 hypothetical protein PPERSA_07445 [Pseudocohnilembus persalinus]